MTLALHPSETVRTVEVRVRGRVQGVGFRPMVWRLAQDCGLHGDVRNDNEGVLIRLRGDDARIGQLVAELQASPPPLAQISRIEVSPFAGAIDTGFRIVPSAPGVARTEIAPDAAVCPACVAEISDPRARRYRYPFTNCTHCGPRLSIVHGVPYDRAVTTMAAFPMCDDCTGEYADPSDRRFHAEPIACPACGPKLRLVRFDGGEVPSFPQAVDDIAAAAMLIALGEIVAIKGLGGYQLACDATQPEVVARLRRLKRREAKPFALMARDLDMIRRYCAVGELEEAALRAREAPIVLLKSSGAGKLPEAVAPGHATLGFMLPATPLHVVLFEAFDRPMVMTSGNVSDAPQVTDDLEAATLLAGIAPYALVHDRIIANRVDDSVVRMMDNTMRVIRRARGHAPAALALPSGFEAASEILAFGPEMKATFCLLTEGRAVLSQHQGDLEDVATYDDYRRNLSLYGDPFAHRPEVFACDLHPDYLSAKLARQRAGEERLPLVEVQHHHAHLASCLAENGRARKAPPVLGIVLDGLGYGSDGAVWGGEFLFGDYSAVTRLGCLPSVAMPGGAQASREPWRNLYAHLVAAIGKREFVDDFSGVSFAPLLAAKPCATLDAMMASGTNAPLASSCGRLFDAVAAALDLSFARQAYEGEAASRLEACVCDKTLRNEHPALAYRFGLVTHPRKPAVFDLAPMWRALLTDLAGGVGVPVIAARFHKGLAAGLADMAEMLSGRDCGGARFDTVALSGGCFQNRILFEETSRNLAARGFVVLSHSAVPANDGGIALGQAVVAAAQMIETGADRRKGH
ncbi:carbamoyltransferase HypF [[Pseudomonas] carboxydohydrogena]|uniref:Carbamoyltransferase HypF n=1 Tax=Afipia carboxydohydrogena TaxID=290 RepID=A0ABY8BQ34_AFICR|nr:carbamoyltransferase HypF [[Pseudomonas] carboxydohydrogena]WEF51081.1 carbamoyltransferase HypF [[Pseudomonas] carboxydohydrogena]